MKSSRTLINTNNHGFQKLAKQGRKLKKLKDRMDRAYSCAEKAKTNKEYTQRHLKYFEAKLDYRMEMDFKRTPNLKVRNSEGEILMGDNALLFLTKEKTSHRKYQEAFNERSLNLLK